MSEQRRSLKINAAKEKAERMESKKKKQRENTSGATRDIKGGIKAAVEQAAAEKKKIPKPRDYETPIPKTPKTPKMSSRRPVHRWTVRAFPRGPRPISAERRPALARV